MSWNREDGMLPNMVGANGAHLTSEDGQSWTDLSMGDGVYLFGHGHEAITSALQTQLERGLGVGPNSALAGENATRLCALTGAERLLFMTTGSEAVMVALRFARAKTQRRRVAIFAQDFHGHFEGILPLEVSGVSADAAEGSLRIEHRDERAFQVLQEHASELAAVLVEPVPSAGPTIADATFLRRLREWTTQNGSALIFNEFATGLRTDARGTGVGLGVEADMVLHGKFLGGGLPAAAVTGRAVYLDQADGGAWRYGDTSQPVVAKTFLAGTFNKHPLAMAATAAVLDVLDGRGSDLRKDLNERSTQFARDAQAALRARGWEITVGNHGSFVRFQGTESQIAELRHALAERRVLLGDGGRCFLSTAHDGAVLRSVLETLASLPAPKQVHASSSKHERLRLFCIHPAGAAATTYREWPGRLTGIDVSFLELPGRGRKQNETFVWTFEAACANLLSELEEELARKPGPFVLFGHSMGALLAFEMARKIGGRTAPLALRRLVLSGEPAPHIGAYATEGSLRDASDDDLITRFLSTGDRSLARALLPRLRADLAVCESYRYTPGARIACPLSVFGGNDDPLAKKDDLERWRELSEGDFVLRVVEGDHSFVRSNPKVCRFILDDLNF